MSKSRLSGILTAGSLPFVWGHRFRLPILSGGALKASAWCSRRSVPIRGRDYMKGVLKTILLHKDFRANIEDSLKY